jgi:SAM-dependent methyltransferase
LLGRIAVRVAPRVKKLYCFDIAEEMIKRAKEALKERQNVEFYLITKPQLPSFLHGTLDFIYSFDVFPHVDLHTLWKVLLDNSVALVGHYFVSLLRTSCSCFLQYIQEISMGLKKSGKAFIHTANIITPLGWSRFVQQDKYTPGGFYFLSPEIVHTLIDKANGFKIIKTSQHSVSNNMYYNRDYLIVLEKM